MKVHHDRTRMGNMVTTYCGKTSSIEVEVMIPELTTNEERKTADHCLRCLRAKRLDKGDAFMNQYGYPLIGILNGERMSKKNGGKE